MSLMLARADAAPWHSHICLSLQSADRTQHVRQLSLEPREQGVVPEPAVRLSLENAQVLMDDLWACGIRPTEGTGSAGALRAVERHLEDMRALVFKTGPAKTRTEGGAA